MISTEKRINFNIIDVIIVLLLAALIAGVFFRENISELLSTEQGEQITYTFEIKQVDSDSLACLNQNTQLFERDSGNSLGKIISVYSTPSMVTEVAVDGSILQLEKRGYYDLTIKTIVDGFKSDTGFFADGDILIVPGKTYNINTETAVFIITILSVN